ncbi:MAG TPA: FtsX-like permease family protein, partial [Bacteroidales bacterium]|nr:FtsX-like permease family protein [Bacteroidales bacterium]
FTLVRNFNHRKKEFGLMMATGFSVNEIRRIIFGEQFIILLSGLFIGLISAILATIHSILSGSQIPWINILFTIILILTAGLTALVISLKTIQDKALIATIRKE